MTPQHPAEWPVALRLVASIIAPTPSSECQALVSELSPEEWREFAELAIRRHRVAPLVADRLAHLNPPTDIAERISAGAREAALEVLRQMQALRRIQRAFASVDVVPVVMKGWPLAERIYGAPAKRHVRDLDLYIPTADLAQCDAELRRLGYRAASQHAQRARLIGNPAMQRECNDIEYRHSTTGQVVEIMWRAHPIGGYPNPIGANAATFHQETSIGPLRVPTERADLFYLSVHGSMHMWSRLKWLADIAWIAERRGGNQLEDDLGAAHDVGVWSTLALALVLANRVFGSALPPSLHSPNNRLTKLTNDVLKRQARSDASLETLGGRVSFYHLGLRLADTPAQKIGYLRFAAWRRMRLDFAERFERRQNLRPGT